MTERLYYNDSYLRQFEAVVTAASAISEDESIVYLDRSAFYPTSGGQPFDTGFIAGHEVRDVYVDEVGDVAHRIEGFIQAGTGVSCQIDWDRRFDHMQQHAGEHILAGCLYKMYDGYTIGLHLGHADSSIDVQLPSGKTHLSEEEIRALEAAVNGHITSDEEIRCYFPGDGDIDSIPLRKAPTVREHIRVVQIGDWEYCACGGTHPSSTGQIGIFKITDARPSKGKVHITFVCGSRALRDYQRHMDTIKQLSFILSADLDKLPAAAEELVAKLKASHYELNKLKTDMALETVKQLAAAAPSDAAVKVVRFVFDEMPPEGLKRAAEFICSLPGHVALLGSRTEDRVTLLFSRHRDVKADMGGILKSLLSKYSGKGGGSSDFARGSATSAAILDDAEAMILQDD